MPKSANSNQKHTIFLVAGLHTQSVDLCSMLLQNWHEAQSLDIKLHHSRIHNLNAAQILDELTEFQQFDIDQQPIDSDKYKSITAFIEDLDATQNHIISGIHLYIKLLPFYLKSIPSERFNIKMIYVFDLHGIIEQQPQNGPITNQNILELSSKFELYSRSINRFAINYQDLINYPQRALAKLYQFTNLKVQDTAIQAGVKLIKQSKHRPHVNFTFDHFNDSTEKIMCSLLSNINGNFVHKIPALRWYKLYKEANHKICDNEGQTRHLAKVKIWDKIDPAIPIEFIFNVDQKIKEFYIDTSKFEDIQKLVFYPLNYKGIIEIK